jgi:3-methylcrotonyl-CoA carboxylase alpha subunit
VDTGLIGRHQAALTEEPDPPEMATALAAVVALGLGRPRAGQDPWDRLAGWRHWSDARQYALLARDDARIERLVVARGHGRYSVEGDGQALDLVISCTEANDAYRVTHDGHSVAAHAVLTGDAVTVYLGGGTFAYSLPDHLSETDDAGAAGDVVTAPMPGLVRAVAAALGQTVKRGDALMVLEAMKMEHTLRAPRDGVVREVMAAAGDQVADGTVLVALEPEAGDA